MTISYSIDTNNGVTVRTNRQDLDNHWIVPYNPYFLATFDCYINVLIFPTIKLAKYLYKYIYKDHDHITFNLILKQVIQQYDEIQQLQLAR